PRGCHPPRHSADDAGAAALPDRRRRHLSGASSSQQIGPPSRRLISMHVRMRVEASMGILRGGPRHLALALIALCCLVAPPALAAPKAARVLAVKLLELPEGASEVFVRTDHKPDYQARVGQ